jgi:outer membrane receptor protein involved in Fe transport
MPNKKQLGLLISTTIAFNGFLAIPCFAQNSTVDSEDDLTLEEVIVTGTRIKTVDGFGRTSPVTVVNMEDISSFGYTRVEEFLNTLPQVQVSSSSFDSNGASGTANLDLRGLGAERNLVLINGRRVQPGGVYSYAPDINQIPSQLIDRVEVLTGGASATYGADAVAGVINFIMRRVNGIEFNIGMNGYQHDNRNGYIQKLMDEKGYDYPTGNTGLDGKAYNVSIVIGGDFADGRGNATAYATWRKNDALLHGQRDYSSCALNNMGIACGGSFFATEIPNFFIAPLTGDGGGPNGYDWYQEKFLVLQPDNSLLEDDYKNPSNIYNFAPINFYMRPDERWSLGAFVDYEINPHAVAYLETMFTTDSTNSQIAESGTFMAFSPLPLDNAYFPENFRKSLEELWPGENDFGIYMGKRNVEGGPRQDIFSHSSFRIVTGVRGSLTDDWEYDMSYMYGQTGSSSTYVNDLLGPKLAVAVDSRLCEADPGCIPYQVFTYRGVTHEAADSISGTGIATAETSTSVIQAYVTGTAPWGLPAGHVMAAAGFEHREVDFKRITDTIYKEGDMLGQGWYLEDLAGGYSVNEFFAEAKIPLLANLSFARNMTLDLAYRWSDYSTSGPSSTYRVGLDWQVLDWLRVRSGYNRAVRAPNIAELYEPQLLGGYPGDDPCEGPEPLYSLEQCARTGVTAEQYGNIDAVPFDGWWHNAIWGGNTNLDPEKSDTLTLGLVFEIGDAMRLSFDYWDIRIEDAIEHMEPATALDQCALYGNLCELVHRAPGSGSLWRSDDGYVYGIAWNLGELHYRGIDTAWNWSPGNHWQMNLIGTYYLKKQKTVIPNDPDTISDCVGLIRQGNFDDPRNCRATPKWRHTATLTYDSNSFWSLTGRWRYFSKITYDGDIDQIASDNLGAQNYLDLNAVFRFMETHDLTLGVNNVLDREPPLVGGPLRDNANSINMYDLLGRFLFANLTFRW